MKRPVWRSMLAVTATAGNRIRPPVWPAAQAFRCGYQQLLATNRQRAGIPLGRNEPHSRLWILGFCFRGRVEHGDRVEIGVGGKQPAAVGRLSQCDRGRASILLFAKLGRKPALHLACFRGHARDCVCVRECHIEQFFIRTQQQGSRMRAGSGRGVWLAQ